MKMLPLLFAFACSSPPTPKEVEERARNDLTTMYIQVDLGVESWECHQARQSGRIVPVCETDSNKIEIGTINENSQFCSAKYYSGQTVGQDSPDLIIRVSKDSFLVTSPNEYKLQCDNSSSTWICYEFLQYTDNAIELKDPAMIYEISRNICKEIHQIWTTPNH